jgi:hypothetical protein
MEYVYVMYDSLSNEVKIGKSKNPYKRMQQARTFNPRILLLTTIETNDAYGLERHLHRIFAAYHNCGEWFHYSEVIKRWLSNYETEEDKQRQKAQQTTITSRTEVQRDMGDVRPSESFLPY